MLRWGSCKPASAQSLGGSQVPEVPPWLTDTGARRGEGGSTGWCKWKAGGFAARGAASQAMST